MKSIIYLLVVLVVCEFGCQSNTFNKELFANKDTISKVEVYYFHQKKSCLTCKTVGKISKELLSDKYGDKSKEVCYHDVNVSDKENRSLIEKFEVNWSGLYILAHTKKGDVMDNLTGFAFMHAITNPDTVNQVLTNKINNYLKQ